jgi:hypothetical protein
VPPKERLLHVLSGGPAPTTRDPRWSERRTPRGPARIRDRLISFPSAVPACGHRGEAAANRCVSASGSPTEARRCPGFGEPTCASSANLGSRSRHRSSSRWPRLGIVSPYESWREPKEPPKDEGTSSLSSWPSHKRFASDDSVRARRASVLIIGFEAEVRADLGVAPGPDDLWQSGPSISRPPALPARRASRRRRRAPWSARKASTRPPERLQVCS